MQQSPLFRMSVIAAAAILPNRFLGMFTGAHCAAGAKAQGVSDYAAAIGETVPVKVLGTSLVESGGAFSKGGPLKSDATGRAIAQGGAGEILAYASEDVAAAGVMTEVLLTP